MKKTAEQPGFFSSLPRLIVHFTAALFLTASWIIASATWLPVPAHSQTSGLRIWVADGDPAQLPADNQSQIHLELDLDSCNFGVPVESDGTFSLSISSTLGTIDPPFATSMDGGEFPPRLTLTAGNQTGEALVEVIASYCPAGAVVLMGVCVDQAYQDATCTGSTTVQLIPPQNPADGDSPENPGAEASTDSQPSGQEPVQDSNQPEEQPEDSLAVLYQDLEEFLAGEGITAPTPGQIGTSGLAITTLLASWILLNQMAGTGLEKSFDVIKAWKKGERPPIGAEADLPADFEDGGVGINTEIAEDSPDLTDQERSQPLEATPAQESAEDRLLRGVKDTQDLDDAVKQTRKDFEAFEDKIPPAVKNSEAWKKHVEPRIKQVKDLLKKGELDKSRTWLDRSEQLIKLRQDVDRDLSYLPDDKREAIVWTERTLKTLGHFATDTYQTLVVDPAKAAGEKLLPKEQAQKWNQAMDELNQELSNVAQGIGELPRKGARLYTHGNLQEQAPQVHQELYGEREVPVEYPDFIGKGTAKVRELWDHTMRCLFHDR